MGTANDISEKSTLQIAHSRAIGQLVRDRDDITRTRMPTSLKRQFWLGAPVEIDESLTLSRLALVYSALRRGAGTRMRERSVGAPLTEGRKAMMVAGGINIRGMG